MATEDVTSRYRPSTATIAIPPDHGRAARTSGFRKRRVVAMFVFTILTIGAYPAIWLLRRRRALNAMDSPRKIAPWAASGVLCLLVVSLVAGIVRGPNPSADPSFEVGFTLVQFALGLWFLYDLFGVRQILEDHVAPESPGDLATTSRLEISGVLTFFLSVYYLQYIINREFVGHAEPSGG